MKSETVQYPWVVLTHMDCKVVVKYSMYQGHLIYLDRKAQDLVGDGLSLEPVGTFQAKKYFDTYQNAQNKYTNWIQ